MKMIVKCQRSITTTEPCAQMLFYPKGKGVVKQFDLTEEWDKHFQPFGYVEGHKFFAYVDWPDKSKPPTFIGKVDEQDW